MERDDQAYYYERAEAELQMAQRSVLPQVVRAHYTIATHYLERVYSDESDQNDGAAEGERSKPLLFGSDN